jgi:hypothetical protein
MAYLRGSRRIDELSVLQKYIQVKIVFKMSGKMQSKEEIKLSTNEWRILSSSTAQGVRQIIDESGLMNLRLQDLFR